MSCILDVHIITHFLYFLSWDVDAFCVCISQMLFLYMYFSFVYHVKNKMKNWMQKGLAVLVRVNRVIDALIKLYSASNHYIFSLFFFGFGLIIIMFFCLFTKCLNWQKDIMASAGYQNNTNMAQNQLQNANTNWFFVVISNHSWSHNHCFFKLYSWKKEDLLYDRTLSFYFCQNLN